MKLYTNTDPIFREELKQTALPLELLPYLNQLNKPRRGWVKRGVHEEGTIEDARQHTAKLVMAAEAIDPQRWAISSIRLRTQALIHELPEVLGIDWTPGEITEEEKFRQEKLNLERLLAFDFPQRQRIIQTWLDYEREKGLAYFLDKMDALVTAEYYALLNPAYLPVADEFHSYGQTKITDKSLRQVIDELQAKARSRQIKPNQVFPTYFQLLGEI
jgi:5'-deoxynucleotidase YfbR-like HD superfamily hydrolase